MAMDVATVFGQIGRVLCVCPECSDLFYLSEARPCFAGKQAHSVVDDLRAAESRLDRAEERLDEIENALREAAAKQGLRATKRALRRIDPLFSGAGYDPQDVRVIFDPVTYVVFNGMGKGRLRDIVLLATPPESSAVEREQKSIEDAVKKGNFEFKTLHVAKDGSVAAR